MKYCLFLILALVVSVPSRAIPQRKCYGLAIEGGGVKNAYSVGVTNAIWKNLPVKDRSYDVVTGTSMGALNAFILAMTQPGDEQGASVILNSIWTHLDNAKIYKSWTWGYIQGLFYKNGLYNTEPFAKTLEAIARRFGGGYKRKLVIGMTEINTGTAIIATESVEVPRMVKYLRAAASTPGYFPPVRDGDLLLVDGSAMISLDITSAIERCREIVEHDEDIVIDLIMANRIRNLSRDCGKMNGGQMLSRYFEINGYVTTMHDFATMLENYPNVHIRYIFYPIHDLPSRLTKVDFNNEDIKAMIKQGEVEATELINSKEGNLGDWLGEIYNMTSL